MEPETKQKAMRAIGFLEGFSAWVWASTGEKLADAYDQYVEEVRKAVMADED